MPKAYSYIRFSSTKQISGDSLDRQIRLSEEYAAKNGLELDTSLNLRDLGISAYDRSNLEKGALGQFLRLIEEKQIEVGSYLLVESLDRLSRDKVLDALTIFISILRSGILIVTLSDKEVYSYEKANGNWTSLIISIAIMSRANEESAEKSRRIRSSWDAKRRNINNKRLTKRCPYWLKPSDGDAGFEFIPERVEVVKRIFKMSVEGIGSATIVKTFNTEGVPLFSKTTHGWQNSYIQKTLQNPAIYGDLHLKLQRDGEESLHEVISNYYPMIMTKEEWLIAASIRAERKNRGGVSKGQALSNLFSGLLKCGYCGGPMNMGGYVENRKGKHKKSKFIACSNARRGLGCKYIQWEYTDFERLVLSFCKEIDLARVLDVRQDFEDELNKKILRIESIKQEVLDIDNRNKKLLDALEKSADGSAVQLIIDRIEGNNNKLQELKVEKKQKQDDVTRLTNSRINATVQQNLIIDLLLRLESLEENDLQLLRIRLSEAIKRVVTKIHTFVGGRWYSEDDVEEYMRDLISSDEYDSDQIVDICSKLDVKPNKKNRLFMIVFKNGEHRTVLSSGKILDQKNAPPTEWDVTTLFESLAFKVFKKPPANAESGSD
jgi:DNA invertase Pin-like site-specific DNA recombinase